VERSQPRKESRAAQLPRRRAKQHAGDRKTVPLAHKIADVFPNAVARPEVVFMGQQALEKEGIGRAGFDDAHRQGLYHCLRINRLYNVVS